MHQISVWLVCKLCRSSYQQVPELIKHKFECHFEQFRSTKQIIFEERLNGEDFGFADEGTLPSPDPCLDTQVKEERERGSYRVQSLNYPRNNISYNKPDEEVVVADEKLFTSFTNPDLENIDRRAVSFTIEKDSVTINVGTLKDLDSAANNTDQLNLAQQNATDSKDLEDAEIEITTVSANLNISILSQNQTLVPPAPALHENSYSKLGDSNPIDLHVNHSDVSIEDASMNITFDSDHDPHDLLEIESTQSDKNNTICKPSSVTTTKFIDHSSIEENNDVPSSLLDINVVTHGAILSTQKNPFVLLIRLSPKEIKRSNKLDQQHVSENPSVVDITNEAPCYDSDPDELNLNNDETKMSSDSDTDQDVDLKPFKLNKKGPYSKQKQFICPRQKCGQNFKRKDILVQHLNYFHGDLEQIRLMACTSPKISDTPEKLSLADWLKKEVKTCNADGNPNVIRLDPDPTTITEQDAVVLISRQNPIKCKLCCKRLVSESHVKKHVKTCWWHNELQHKYCVPCNKSFPSTTHFRQHNFRKHLSVQEKIAQANFKCDLCPKVFYASSEFKNHTETHKSKEEQQQRKPFVCEICGYTCIYLGMLDRHIATTHSNIRRFKCSLENCDTAFKTKTGFQTHMRVVHSQSKPFKCTHSNCAKSFKRKNDLKTHTRLIHEGIRRYPLQIFHCTQDNCDKSFELSRSLTCHLKIVHNIGPELQPFPCDVCKKVFRSKIQLKTHTILVHTQDFPFNCTYEGCSAAYKLKARLVEHERVHSGQKYLCTVCGKSYSIYISFHKHQLSHKKTTNANAKKNGNTSKRKDGDNSSISDSSSND